MKNRKLLVPIDDSQLSKQTLKSLIALKEEFGTPLTLLHVLDPSRISYRGFAEKTIQEIENQARETAQQFIAEKQAELAAAGIASETLIREGFARETICQIAESGEYDILVVGRPVDSDLRKLMFGQVANYVIHHVNCPVLIV